MTCDVNIFWFVCVILVNSDTMTAIFKNFGILIFVLLNIVLPTVDVITDMLMIIKLFRGAYGCVNPRWWSEDHKLWHEQL